MENLLFHLVLDLAEVYAIVTVACAPMWLYRRLSREPAAPQRSLELHLQPVAVDRR
jgi:hypothetical protein